MDLGICYIKPEFLIEDYGECKKNCKVDDNEDNKKIVGNAIGKKRKRGQYKNRPVFKEDRSISLCRVLLNGPTDVSCGFKNCIYSHDIQEYLMNKPKDIGSTCYVYSIKGFCPRGLTCRFAEAHIDKCNKNIKHNSFDAGQVLSTSHGLTKDLQLRLRKYDYDFSDTKNLVQSFENSYSTKIINTDEQKPIGSAIIEDDGKESNCRTKSFKFHDKVLLSPLTTVGNLPFRRICKEFGADITCGEMACAVPLLKGLPQEWALTKRHESEDIFGVQLCGNSAQIISQAAQLVKENINVDFVDLNIGCPIDLIYKSGGGSALIRRTHVLEIITRTCSTLLGEIPFTVKTRTGVYADKSVSHDLVPKLEEWGASAVTIHGRSREQRYTKAADWKYIETCAKNAKNIAIIGNGDIMNFEDYNEKKHQAPHVSSIMIGRGALIKPWIFKEIKEQKHWDPSSSERFEILKRYVNYGLEHWGSDTRGVETTRRFLLEWLSFLYRYIPFNIINNPPQKINQRPQKYRSRDELETLMSSGNCTDWIKLSEMLLGKVPEGFEFLPKHKANSY